MMTARHSIPDHLTKPMGRWPSDAYQLFVKTPLDSLQSLMCPKGCGGNRYFVAYTCNYRYNRGRPLDFGRRRGKALG